MPRLKWRLGADDLPAELQNWINHTGDAAVVADPSGGVVRANSAAVAILRDGALPDGLVDAVVAAVKTQSAQSMGQAVGGGADRRQYQVHVIPLFGPAGGRRLVLVTARDVTLETNLTTALSESRRRFKELVDCSADFAWETDESGRLTFVSEGGALGFPAGWLEGKDTYELLADGLDGDTAPANPFLTRRRLNDEEIRLFDKDGRVATILLSAVPIAGPGGEWRGARGVCRDITLIREHEEALRQARQREAILSSLVASIRDRIEPEMMVKEAAVQTARVLQAPLCALMRMERGALKVMQSFEDGSADGMDTLRQYGERQLSRLARDPESSIHALSEMAHRGLLLMGALTSQDRRINGAICVARPHEMGPWSENDRKLLEGVSDYVGIAIAQIGSQERLKRLSRTDELTGLLNRRGFQDHVEPRIKALKRAGQHGALIYADLDHFKQVNDRYGHDRGDLVLRTFGIYLDGHTRGSDYCARLGGDEFAIWLDNTTRDGAIQKAERLLELSRGLQEVAGETDPALSMSLGIVMTDPKVTDDLNSLFDRADRAMYAAKNKGKTAYVVAEPEAILKTG